MPPTPRTHRDLVAWQLGMDLTADAYRLSRLLPPEERFGLAQQLTRAAASVPANIAEGYGLMTKAQFRRHLLIANGSLKETETHFEVAVRVGFLSAAQIQDSLAIASRLGAVLRGLRDSLA